MNNPQATWFDLPLYHELHFVALFGISYRWGTFLSCDVTPRTDWREVMFILFRCQLFILPKVGGALNYSVPIIIQWTGTCHQEDHVTYGVTNNNSWANEIILKAQTVGHLIAINILHSSEVHPASVALNSKSLGNCHITNPMHAPLLLSFGVKENRSWRGYKISWHL